MKQKPHAQTVFSWLAANLGKRALAPLTGSDTRALMAAVQIAAQYAYDRDPSIIMAFGLIVRRMQPSTRELAYHAIAHPRDWSNREEMWIEAGLPSFVPRICAFEPGGSGTECD